MISKKKIQYPISDRLLGYLDTYGRTSQLPLLYQDLTRFTEAIPYEDASGRETLWQTVGFLPQDMAELRPKLTEIYHMLKIGKSDHARAEHLDVERIDYGDFGNSKPFRVRIVNQFNDNFDHYYIKRPDASRVCGLELEHVLSPNRINYLVSTGTLVEEHIAGVPGNVFVKEHLESPGLNAVRVAKEFVKFSERCFTRLLGDMRSVNYVVDITPDFEEVQYRVRPIDFDQQSYEGRRNVYLPQFFIDNNPAIDLVTRLLNQATIRQYQEEERSLVARRRSASGARLDALLACMCAEPMSPPEKIAQLKSELDEYHHTAAFSKCQTMGEVVATNIDIVLSKR